MIRKNKTVSEVPETVFYVVYILRNSVGVQPLMILNILMKADNDEKPQLTATSVMELRGSVSSVSAWAMRF